MAFPTFFTDMPYLVRQEIAFFFLALLLLAATEPTASARGRRGCWSLVLGLGVVLSHYSTTYVMLMGLVAALGRDGRPAAAGRPRCDTDPRTPTRRAPLVLLNPVVVAVLVAASLRLGRAGHPHRRPRDGRRREQTVRRDHRPGRGRARLLGHLLPLVRQGQDDPAGAARPASSTQTLDYRDDAASPAQDLLVKQPGPAELRPAIVPASTGAADGSRARC